MTLRVGGSSSECQGDSAAVEQIDAVAHLAEEGADLRRRDAEVRGVAGMLEEQHGRRPRRGEQAPCPLHDVQLRSLHVDLDQRRRVVAHEGVEGGDGHRDAGRPGVAAGVAVAGVGGAAVEGKPIQDVAVEDLEGGLARSVAEGRVHHGDREVVEREVGLQVRPHGRKRLHCGDAHAGDPSPDQRGEDADVRAHVDEVVAGAEEAQTELQLLPFVHAVVERPHAAELLGRAIRRVRPSTVTTARTASRPPRVRQCHSTARRSAARRPPLLAGCRAMAQTQYAERRARWARRVTRVRTCSCP